MRNVVTTLQAAIAPAALLIISHARKLIRDQPADLLTDNRGSNYLTGKADGIVRMWANEKGSEGLLTYRSRAVPQTEVTLVLRPDGFWQLKDPGRLAIALRQGLTQRAAGRWLCGHLGTWEGNPLDPDLEKHVEMMRQRII